MIRPTARRVAQLAALSLSAILCAPLRTAEAQSRQSVDEIFTYIQQKSLALVGLELERHPEQVSARNERGETPLHFAARLNNAAIVAALLAKGADVDARDQRYGQTPLFTWLAQDAEATRSVEVPELLLAAGADMYAQGSVRGGSNTPLQRLRERLRKAWVDDEEPDRATLITAYDMPTSFWRSNSAAERALVELFQQHDSIGLACSGSAEELAALARRVPKALAHHDRFGRTPLFVAVYYGRQDMVNVLIEHGADPKAVDTSGGNLLRACAYWNHAALAASLRKKHGLVDDVFTTVAFGSAAELGAWLDAHPQDLTAKDLFGMPPLHWAVRRGAADRVQLLLARGADPLAADSARWTALDLAGGFGDVEACRLLAEAGQKAGAKTEYLVSALKLAAFAPDPAAFEALRVAAPEHKSELDGEALIAACGARRTDLALRVLDSTKVTPSTSALSVAAARGSAELVTLLLDRGAKLRGSDRFGRTPLYVAADRGHAHIVRLLLDRGAAVDQPASENGATPLLAAVDRHEPIIADMLLAAGADPLATDQQGRSPIEHRTTDEVKRILKRWDSKDDRAP